MNKKLIFVFIIIIGMLIIPSYQVQAKTLRQLQEELNQLEKEYNANKNKKELTESEIKTLNNQLVTISANITKTKKEIEQAQQEIINNQKEIEEKHKETDELLKFLQVSSGENVYLEYLFEADSFTDLIYRYSVVSQLSSHNNELMKELERLNNELEQNKKTLAEKQVSLEGQSNEYNSKLIKLRANLTTIDADGITIEGNIEAARKTINYYKNKGCSLDQSLDDCNNVAYATGWRYPIAYGIVTSLYTGKAERTDWSGGGGHHGIDLANSQIYGMSVYAAASGTVGYAGWITGGGNAVYIYHNVGGENYTTVYMHLSSIATGIKVGAKVTSDTVIGYAGNTGGNYGAHLHFGVAKGGHYLPGTDFNDHSINPSSILKFSSGTYQEEFRRQ